MCPMLNPDEIQGDILPGFRRRHFPEFHQAFVFLIINDADAARDALSMLVDERITWSSDLFTRARRNRGSGEGADGHADVNVAFTRGGLVKVRPDLADRMAAYPAFEAGLAARSNPERLLGPPENWLVGGPAQQIDVVLNIGLTKPLGTAVESLLASIRGGLTEAAPPPNPAPGAASRFDGQTLPGGIEHFGFRDGLSQPSVEIEVPAVDNRAQRRWPGRYPPPAGRPLATYVDSGELAQRHDEAVRPCAATSHEDDQPIVPAVFASAPRVPSSQFIIADDGFWTNGSFMVWLRLRQDVHAFRRACARIARKLSIEWGRPVTPDDAAALIVGRRRDGTPLALCGLHDANEFSYRQASRFRPDPFGMRCPLGAHSRKMNPRTTDELVRLILRRGIPYGAPMSHDGDDGEDRGLLFIAYQASIENQYEMLQGTWANRANLPERHGSPDAMVSSTSWTGTTTIEIPNPDGRGSVGIGINNDWVVPTGGLYLFVPSRSAMAELTEAL
jgi:Dyp-type peroxidase family